MTYMWQLLARNFPISGTHTLEVEYQYSLHSYSCSACLPLKLTIATINGQTHKMKEVMVKIRKFIGVCSREDLCIWKKIHEYKTTYGSLRALLEDKCTSGASKH